MIFDYSKERLFLFDQAIKDRKGFVAGKSWTFGPDALRFRHGESLAELKIPYHLGGEDELIIGNAINALFLLLKRRFERPEAEGREELPPDFDVTLPQPLKEKTYRIDLLPPGSVEGAAAFDALCSIPLLDGAILTNWLGPQGQGKLFVGWADALMEKALKEEAGIGAGEMTGYLALLAMVEGIRKKKARLNELRIKGLAYEKLDIIVGFLLHGVLRRAINSLFERLGERNAPYYTLSSEMALKTVVTPRAFLSIPSNLLTASLNPYGITKELFDMLSPFAPKKGEAPDTSSEFIELLSKRVKTDKAVTEAVTLQHNISRFRDIVIDYLVKFDTAGGMEGHRIFYDLYQEDRLIKNVLSDPLTAERVIEAAGNVKKQFFRDLKRIEALESLEGFLSALHGKKGWFKKAAKETVDDTFSGVLEGFIACWLDEHVESFTAPMRTCLVDRRETFDNNMLVEEYKKGRLYRFSVDERAVLKTLELGYDGQLFVDMKDFTRKTLKVKEIAMAEFMKENFYNPILDKASLYARGAGLLESEGGIKLTALAGDAAIFSGSVVMLVSLARDIRKVIGLYRDKLASRLHPGKDELIVEDINKRFEEKKDALRKTRTRIEEALSRGQKEAGAELLKLGEEEHRLEKSYRDELEAAINLEMEAGLFISYGTKAETILIDAKEDFTDRVNVAIGEKINEAARGTGRNIGVRAKMEMILEKERIKRQNLKLRHPFEVFIDKTYTIRIPPELDNAIAGLMAKKKGVDTRAVATWIAKEFLGDLESLSEGRAFYSLRVLGSSTDIYNKGQAMSEDALMAYIKELKGRKTFFKKTVNPASLDKSIRDNFYFPSDRLELWFDYEMREGVEIIEGFCRAGELVFRGFEMSKPAVVYEILNADGEFFALLKTCHFREWLEEAKKGKGI